MATPIAEVAVVVCSNWSSSKLADLFSELGYREYADFIKTNNVDGAAFCEILALDCLVDMGL